jgi:catalase (peroxidase I)
MMKVYVILVAIIALASALPVIEVQTALDHELTVQEIATISEAVLAVIPPDVHKSFELDSNATADVVGGAIQLAFHDAGTYDKSDGSGGPDGCVAMNIDENKGLWFINSLLDPIYARFKTIISKADFNVLAANVMMEARKSAGYVLKFPFKYGRIDGTDCETVDVGRLPEAAKSMSHVVDVFADRMGLSMRDITALMGAHSVGRAQDVNSGYDGAWDSSRSRFDHSYYLEMVRKPWTRVEHTSTFDGKKHVQWEIPGENVRMVFGEPAGKLMLLNTDMCLAFDIGDGEDLNENIASKCIVKPPPNRGGCPPAPYTREYVDLYIEDNQAFYDDFVAGWTKMTELGWEGKLKTPSGEIELTPEEQAARDAQLEAERLAREKEEANKDPFALDSDTKTFAPKDPRATPVPVQKEKKKKAKKAEK